MRNRIIAIMMLTLGARAAAADEQKRVLTLEEALAEAAKHQPTLAEAHAQTEIAEAKVIEARAGILPSIVGTATYRRATSNSAQTPGLGVMPKSPSFTSFNFFNIGVTGSVVIWDFGQTRSKVKVAEANAEAQAVTEKTSSASVILDVRTAYYNAWGTKALIGVAQDTLANQQKHLVQVQGFVDVGTKAPIDLAQAKTDVANAQVQVIEAENAYATAKAQLDVAMGVVSADDYDVSDQQPPAVAGEDSDLDPLVKEAINARPELASLRAATHAAEISIDAAHHEYYPSIVGSLALTAAGTEVDNLAPNWSIAVALTWPIWQGGVVKGHIREAQWNAIALDAQAEGLRQSIRLEVNQARLAVRAAKAEVEASAEARKNAAERLTLAQGRYETGAGSGIELGDAQVALTAAEAQEVQAQYKLALARAQLMKALGRP
jgi:outer membrane protein